MCISLIQMLTDTLALKWYVTVFGAYSAVGSILARLGQTFVTISFTVDTKEANRTGTSVPINYVLHVN